MPESKKKNRGAVGAERRSRKTNQDLQIEALSRRVSKLESALDKNTQIFSDTMKVLEIKVNVLEEVISTLHSHGHGLVESKDGRVDFGYYLQQYLKELGAKEEQAAAPTPPTKTIVSPDEDAPVIFGGDGP